MRIDHLEIENFKKFAHQSLDFHPQFTLLAGDNGSGKTTVLDALAVALGIWHTAAPGSGWRNILTEEIRLAPFGAGDRTLFQAQLPVSISVRGNIGNTHGLRWTRMIRDEGTRTTNAEAKAAQLAILQLVAAARSRDALLPVLAYYGAGRAWLPTNQRPRIRTSQQKPRQLDAYHNCLDTRIRDTDINEWFLFETAASPSADGRPGYRAVKQAVLSCIPDADGLRYDSDRKEIVLSIRHAAQPYYNLSAGQRMMLAMVADIAIKTVTLNSHLLGPERPGARDPLLLLEQTPGVVLIDELDVHLHPRWQRRVAADLKRIFPSIQFVCTTHSPQVIGELAREEIRLLDAPAVYSPPRSLGIDSSRILQEIMDTPARNEATEDLLKQLSVAIDREDFAAAYSLLQQAEHQLGSDDPEMTRARALMAFLETKA